MTSTEIKHIYSKLLHQYKIIAQPIIDSIWDGSVTIERPKVMFPPNDGVSFDSQIAESGFLQRNCAVISAYRQKKPDGTKRSKKDNEASSKLLEEDLKTQELAYFTLDGCFREKAEKKASHEVSFFVYDDGTHQARHFFMALYKLSEKYNQDSFLYKSAGMSRFAFLISTNDKTRKEDGDINPAGKLYLNLPPVGPYSDLQKGKKGRFTFRLVPPTEEEIEYSLKVAKKVTSI